MIERGVRGDDRNRTGGTYRSSNVLDLSMWEQEVLGALRQSSECWIPLWLVAKRAGCGVAKASSAVARLRARGLVVKRPCAEISRIEVSLARSGL